MEDVLFYSGIMVMICGTVWLMYKAYKDEPDRLWFLLTPLAGSLLFEKKYISQSILVFIGAALLFMSTLFAEYKMMELDKSTPVLEQGSDPGPEQSCPGGNGGNDESDSE